MKLLIDTDWFSAIKDLQKSKQKEIIEAILDYPNKDPDAHLWKNVIKPTLERGKIKYYNCIKNLKQNNPQKSAKKITGSDPESDTGSGIDINKYNNDIEKDRLMLSTTRTRAKKTAEEIIKQTAEGMRPKNSRYIQITPDLVFPPDQFFDAYRQQLPNATARAEQWLRKSNLVGKTITLTKAGEIIRKFNENKKQKNT